MATTSTSTLSSLLHTILPSLSSTPLACLVRTSARTHPSLSLWSSLVNANQQRHACIYVYDHGWPSIPFAVSFYCLSTLWLSNSSFLKYTLSTKPCKPITRDVLISYLYMSISDSNPCMHQCISMHIRGKTFLASMSECFTIHKCPTDVMFTSSWFSSC
jgi:hypothetical protein